MFGGIGSGDTTGGPTGAAPDARGRSQCPGTNPPLTVAFRAHTNCASGTAAPPVGTTARWSRTVTLVEVVVCVEAKTSTYAVALSKPSDASSA